MTKSANARFAIKSWDEKPYSEGQDLPKLTRAAVIKTFTGDIEGEGQVEYLMMYASDGSATFVGLERVVGRIAGKAGTFVLQRTGVFENGQAKESFSVIPGSGTGELRGLRDESTSAVGHGMEHPIALNYELVAFDRLGSLRKLWRSVKLRPLMRRSGRGPRRRGLCQRDVCILRYGLVDLLDLYARNAPAFMPGHPATYLTRFGHCEVREGAAAEGVAIIQFPTFEAAKACTLALTPLHH